MTITLDQREVNTVLAALRCWQAEVCGVEIDRDTLITIATNFHSEESCTAEEIDLLCLRINLGA